jgi:UDP-N-acetylglucosamine diphosphorylase/glucosamine-1-phosphate N-acetyltransferase
VASDGIVVRGPHAVWCDAEVQVEPHTLFDTTAGPILLGRGTLVQAFTRLTGPCAVGPHSVISGGRVSTSAIGDTCKVHGEVSHCIFVGHANKGHDGFVGHSVLGRWVNLGAGTTTSNLKNTYGPVALWTPAGVQDTGLTFLGTLFGDHVKTGIGLRLTTGCVLGAGANVVDAMPPKVVAPFSWGSGAPYATYDVSRFVETAARVMARRAIPLSAAQAKHLRAAHARRWSID